MKALLISDKDVSTKLSEDLKIKLLKVLEDSGYKIKEYELGKSEIFQCLGCLKCFTEHPGKCVNKDEIYDIRMNVQEYSATFYLTPVLFGHYSSTVDAAINKGTGSHRWQVILGYGSDIDDEEKSTFIDLTAKHRGKADIVHPGMDDRVDVFLTTTIEDNIRICEAIMTSAGKL